MRGALNEFQRVPAPIPEEAQRELDKLFGIEEEDPRAVQTAQVSEHEAQVAQCAKDWRSLSTSDFKRKWPSRDHQATIDEAWGSLEKQDRTIADGQARTRESREREAHSAFGTTPLLPRSF
jgi:hypothetical protein